MNCRRPNAAFPRVALIHVMCWVKPEGWNENYPKADEIFDRLSHYDLILTGHNHRQFVIEREGRLLVNPGSLFRMAADQEDHHPTAYLWWAKEARIERVPLPREEGVITREHLDQGKGRDERIAAFVGRLQEHTELGLSFRRNLEGHLQANPPSERVREICWACIEGEE